MTEEGRKIEGANFTSDAQVIDLGGRRCLRIDMSRPDSLGQLRLSEQTWYDVQTLLPVPAAGDPPARLSNEVQTRVPDDHHHLH